MPYCTRNTARVGHMDGSHAPGTLSHSSPNTNNLSIEKGILLELELRANFKFETSRMTDDESGTVNRSSNGPVRHVRCQWSSRCHTHNKHSDEPKPVCLRKRGTAIC